MAKLEIRNYLKFLNEIKYIPKTTEHVLESSVVLKKWFLANQYLALVLQIDL